MRIAACTVVAACLAVGVSSSCPADEPAAAAAAVQFFALADPKAPAEVAAKAPLEDLKLAPAPLLTLDDIVWYDQRSCRVFLKLKDARPLFMAQQRENRPVAVVVTAAGARRFLATLHLPNPPFRGYASYTKPTAEDDPAQEEILAADLLCPWTDMDPRDDAPFLDALRRGRRLDPAALARPKMTRDEAVAAARKADMAHDHDWPNHKPEPVPEGWKVSSVTFCREATVACPSMNILGFGGPYSVCHCWLVVFDPGKETPAWRRAMACVVNDRTGAATCIFPPAHVAALPVPGTDLPPLEPWQPEEKAREAVGRTLKEITRIEFVESVEFRRAPAVDGAQPPWETIRHVWVSTGRDAAGNETTAILSDPFIHYRPPHVIAAGVAIRRKVLPHEPPPAARPGE